MKIYLLLLFSILIPKSAKTQSDLATSDYIANRQDSYTEKVAYYGANQDYYTLSTFLKDSTLYRVDTYRLIEKVNPFDTQAKPRKIAIHQGQTKIMYPTGQVYLTCEYDLNVLHGPLLVYYADGSLKRRERYRHGFLLESQCHTPEGNKQTCNLLYRQPHFTGKPGQLRRYLEKSLQNIAEREQVKDITVSLTINELGQIARIDVESISNPTSSSLVSPVLEVVRAMPQWTSGRFNWQPATMDGVAIEERWVIYIARRQGFLYVYLPHS